MLGLILLLVFKVCSSIDAIAIWGSNTILTCTLPGSNYYWQKRTDQGWSSHIQAGAKYGNVNSEYMTIYNIQIDDGGRYRCGDYFNLEQVDVSVRVNGVWGSWGDWTQCTKTCDGGTRTQYRACDNPSPVNDGSPCPGLHNETCSCSTTISCPVGSEDDHSSATIDIGAGIGSTAVVIGLLIVFIYILKRYRLRKPAESAMYDTTGDTGSSNSDLHIYSGLQQNTESPTHRQNDVIYVNTNI